MRNFLSIILITLNLACSESWKTIPATEFNKTIAGRIDIKTAEDVAKLFYAYPENEGNPSVQISKKALGKRTFEVQLIHDNQEDDSQRAEKIILVIEKIGLSWKVLEIKTNWKCRDGRGHTDWGIEYCN